MKFFLVLFLILALILEISLTTIPLVFIVLLVFTLAFKKNYMFAIAFFVGLFFDILSFKPLGVSSIFFVVFLYLVLIYQSKFEIASNNFVFASSFLGSLAFLMLSGYNNSIILQVFLASVISLVLFTFIKRIDKSNLQTSKII